MEGVRKSGNPVHLCQVYNSAIQRLRETFAGIELIPASFKTSNMRLLKAMSRLSVPCLLALEVKGQGIICCTAPWFEFLKTS